MANIVYVTEQVAYPYRTILKKAGHIVSYLTYQDLFELSQTSNRDYLRADVFIVQAEHEAHANKSFEYIRQLPPHQHTAIIAIGDHKTSRLNLDSYISALPSGIKGSQLNMVVNGMLQSVGTSSGVPVDGAEVERIIRSIEFPPEYHRSGITILSYFADVLRHKNLSEDVKVSIEQSGLNVSLVIESPSGQRELVERTLEAYALVITKRQPIEILTTDPYEIAELKSQLRIADAQIESQRDLMAVKTAEVTNLRAEVEETKGLVRRMERRADEDRERFLSLIEGLVSHNTEISAKLMELLRQASQAQNTALSGALENLYKVINRGVREEDREEVMNNLTTIQREDPGVFRQVFDTLLMGAISEGAGNYLYAWLQFFVGTLPK